MSLAFAPSARSERSLPPVLIASYPRTGSTTLEAALAVIAGPGATVLHEPFRSQANPHARNFVADFTAVVAETDILKHHPGNVLSDRQNRLLYRAWLDRGGRIVHLRRDDVVAQARSLVIARAINSFHRPHRVSIVPPDRVEAQYEDLIAEIDHQSRILSEFDHVEVAYEQLCTGQVDRRVTTFAELLGQLDPSSPPIGAAARERLAAVLSPRRQVRGAEGPGAAVGERVPLIDQVPRFVGTIDLLAADACRRLENSIHEHLRQHPGRDGSSHGVATGWLGDAIGEQASERLRRRVVEELAAVASLRTVIDSPAPPLAFARCDGDVHPDHDLDLWPLPASAELMVAFTVALSDPTTYGGGETHVAGQLPQSASRRRGAVHYFASGLGARRSAVTFGAPTWVIGALPLAPGQILAAGQLPWTPSMFAD